MRRSRRFGGRKEEGARTHTGNMDGRFKAAHKAASQSKVIPRKADVPSLPAFVVLHLFELKFSPILKHLTPCKMAEHRPKYCKHPNPVSRMQCSPAAEFTHHHKTFQAHSNDQEHHGPLNAYPQEATRKRREGAAEPTVVMSAIPDA